MNRVRKGRRTVALFEPWWGPLTLGLRSATLARLKMHATESESHAFVKNERCRVGLLSSPAIGDRCSQLIDDASGVTFGQFVESNSPAENLFDPMFQLNG